MVHIKDVRIGNLLIHKEIGISLVIKIDKSPLNQSPPIIYAIDQDDTIYSGPCEDWFYFWSRPPIQK